MDFVDNTEELKQKIKSLPLKDRVKAVAAYHHLQERKKADDQMEEDIRLLQKKYDQLSIPIFEEIQQLASGLRAPTVEELSNASKYLTPEELEKFASIQLTAAPVENYWLKVLQNAELDALAVTERDEEALKHLQSIEYLQSDNKYDYTIRFRFSENEFFTNAYLDKTYIHGSKGETTKTEATKIEWKDGKNVTKKTVKKKQKNKRSGATRVVSKEVDAESFFLYFRSVDVTNLEKLDEDTQADIQEQMEVDQDIGSLFIDELIPYSIEYYLGIKQSYQGDLDQLNEKVELKAGDDEDDFSDQSDEKPKAKAAPKKKK